MKWVRVIPFSGAGNSAIWHLLGRWYPIVAAAGRPDEFGTGRARYYRRSNLDQMREILGPPLRAAAPTALILGLVLQLLNPPSFRGLGDTGSDRPPSPG